MRKIEKEMIEAIKNNKNYTKDNTKVCTGSSSDCIHILLHGHKIALMDTVDNTLTLKDCGYQTKTTKSRLNAILSHFGLPAIYAKKFQWYLGYEEWTGNKTFELYPEQKEVVTVMKA